MQTPMQTLSTRHHFWTGLQVADTRSHYLERASALDFKDAATPRFGHSDVVFDLFDMFLLLINLLSDFSKLF